MGSCRWAHRAVTTGHQSERPVTGGRGPVEKPPGLVYAECATEEIFVAASGGSAASQGFPFCLVVGAALPIRHVGVTLTSKTLDARLSVFPVDPEHMCSTCLWTLPTPDGP